jgi:3-oxoacyl-(acyl-carrier-protein) synthase
MRPNNKLRLLMTMNHMVGALLAMDHHITGHLSVTSTASSSGAIAIGEAFRLIKHGYQDKMITGGVDFNLNRHFFEGMELFGANVYKYNDNPAIASRPYDIK